VARQIAKRLAEPDYWCLLAEWRGQVVGHAVIRQSRTLDEARAPLPGVAHLWHLFVRPRRWGTGVATRLLTEAMRAARSRGYCEARLWTPRDNARSRAFYSRSLDR
jgi:GNAT superfamily N-acetyltransferase